MKDIVLFGVGTGGLVAHQTEAGPYAGWLQVAC